MAEKAKATLTESMILVSIRDDSGQQRKEECVSILTDMQDEHVNKELINPHVLHKCQNFAAGKSR